MSQPGRLAPPAHTEPPPADAPACRTRGQATYSLVSEDCSRSSARSQSPHTAYATRRSRACCPATNSTYAPADAPASGSRGQAMVEFTLILPLLLLLILGIYQFGQTYADYIQVTNAARDGGRKALVSRSDASGVADAVTAAKNATWWLDKSQIVVSVSPGQPWAQGQTVTVTVTYPYSINLLGLVVASGNLKSTTTVRME